MKRHHVLFLISFALVAVALILAVVLTVQVRRLSYSPPEFSERTMSKVSVDGIPT